MTTTITAACIRGCSLYNRHLVDCEDPDACRGCLPRRAEHGHLCWPCHRRWELMLTDADTVDRWLSGHVGAMAAPAIRDDYERPGSHDLPDAIKVHIYDHRQVLRDFFSTTVDELVERENLTGPQDHAVDVDAEMLLTWGSRVEYWPHIGDLWEYLAGEFSIAHALAPWRPEMKRVPGIPCPQENCGECNLVIFGGESDISCLSCSHMIPEAHFGLWSKILTSDPVSVRAS